MLVALVVNIVGPGARCLGHEPIELVQMSGFYLLVGSHMAMGFAGGRPGGVTGNGGVDS